MESEAEVNNANAMIEMERSSGASRLLWSSLQTKKTKKTKRKHSNFVLCVSSCIPLLRIMDTGSLQDTKLECRYTFLKSNQNDFELHFSKPKPNCQSVLGCRHQPSSRYQKFAMLSLNSVAVLALKLQNFAVLPCLASKTCGAAVFEENWCRFGSWYLHHILSMRWSFLFQTRVFRISWVFDLSFAFA